MNIYILAFLLLFGVSSSSLLLERQADLKTEMDGTAKIVFKSTDGGQTWQNISKGLPENLQEEGIRGNRLYVNDKGLFIRVENQLYHNTPNATAPFWTKEISPNEHSSSDSVKSVIAANNYYGVNFRTTNGTNLWSPIFDDQEPRIRSVFETSGGTVFIGTNTGFFKTDNNGKTWKLAHAGYLVGHLAELNGVLMAISNMGMIRSIDNGETWNPVTCGDGVAWDVKQIEGGFAAITAGSETETRRLRTSYDGGKTWQPIDDGLEEKVWQNWNNRPQPHLFATSITQIGEDFFCTHTKGIYKSTDKGKTWKLLLPSVEDKVFNLFHSGNVIYAIPSKGGC